MIEIPLEYLSIAHAITVTEGLADWQQLNDCIRDGMPIDIPIKVWQEELTNLLRRGESTKPEEILKAKQQLSSPLFRQWLGAKLGMM